MTAVQPPHDLDAEGAVLSACLLDPDCCEVFFSGPSPLSSEDFFARANREVAETLCAFYDADRPIDLVTVRADLDRRGVLAIVGGSAYLAQLSDCTPAVANVASHVALVQDCARRRRVIDTCRAIESEAYAPPHDLEGWADSLAARIQEAIA